MKKARPKRRPPASLDVEPGAFELDLSSQGKAPGEHNKAGAAGGRGWLILREGKDGKHRYEQIECPGVCANAKSKRDA